MKIRDEPAPEVGIIEGRFWVIYWRGTAVLYVRRRRR